MFYFRINRLRVDENRAKKSFLGLLGKDLATMHLMSFVTTDDSALINPTAILATNDPSRREAIVTQAVEQAVSSRIVSEIKNVRDHSVMTFGDTGYVLHQARRMPSDFNWCLVAVESNQHTRDTGALIQRVTGDQEFRGLVNSVVQLAGNANPAYATGAAVVQFAARVIAREMQSKHDDLVGLVLMSLNRREHYPHGLRNAEAVKDLTGNLAVDYSIFGFDEDAALALPAAPGPETPVELPPLGGLTGEFADGETPTHKGGDAE